MTVFPKVAGGGLNEFTEMTKKVVITVIDGKDKNKEDDMIRMTDMAEQLATKYGHKYHHDYQFIWMDGKETIDTITMMDVTPPFLLVLDPNTKVYFRPTCTTWQMTLNLFETFLVDVYEGKSMPLGETGFIQGLKRLSFDSYTTVYRIYNESPLAALLMFGVPSMMIAIICYTVFCVEPLDDDTLHTELGSDGERDDESSRKAAILRQR